MNDRLLMNLKKYAAAFPLLISAFIVSSVNAAQAEALFLFRSHVAAPPPPEESSRTIQQKILKPDKRGDLAIQCGCARFTVAYNDPADRFKPTEQQYNPQRGQTSNINGISLTAILTF